MLRPFEQDKIGILTGCTQILGQNWFEQLQAVDWFYGQYLIKQFCQSEYPGYRDGE
jgi:hypothetical protein